MIKSKLFYLGDLFKFKAIKQAKSQRSIPNDPNGIPYIVQSRSNNMVSRYVNKDWLIQHNEPPVRGNAIVLGVTLPAVSYQPYEFGASQVITARSTFLNELNGLYFVTLLQKQMQYFSYTNKPGLEKYKKLQISLPIDENDNIDFQYMEDQVKVLECSRVKVLEYDRVKSFNNYLTVTGLNNCQITDEDKQILNQKPEYSEFKIKDIFEIHKGKRLTKADQTIGNTLFVGSTSFNHGETARIGQNPIFKPNTITVCYNGSVGETFYQEEPYWASDDVNVLTLKGFKLNAAIAEYLCTIIKKVGKAYGYTYKWNVKRMKETTISLPVKTDNTIDFEYMEKYIKAIQKITIKDIVKYKDNVIKKTKEIVDNK